MNLESLFFIFDKRQRRGFFYILILLLILIFFSSNYQPSPKKPTFIEDQISQKEIDSLRKIVSYKDSIRKYQKYNPNYLSDYTASLIGLNTQEIDRLKKFRNNGSYIHSMKELKKIIKLPDSMVATIEKRLKFTSYKPKDLSKVSEKKYNVGLNKVSAQELMRQFPQLDKKIVWRIVNFRKKLGGFVKKTQLLEVYQLDKKNYAMILAKYPLKKPAAIKKIPINTASAKEISSLVYISNWLAKKIVVERNRLGGFTNYEELMKIKGFPTEKIESIKLYLSL